MVSASKNVLVLRDEAIESVDLCLQGTVTLCL
jgi:hypothetical protein